MLRDYQEKTLNAIVEAYDAGITRQLIVKATGTGKTVDFSNIPAAMASRLPGQMWVIAHREELIDQAVTSIRHWNPSLLVDKEMAEYEANPGADVIVSCVASIGRKGTKRANRFDWDAVDKVIIDEAHHTPASTYQNFLELAGIMVPDEYGKLVPNPDSKKLLVGVTATPARGDGKALAGVYQKIVFEYPMRRAIEDGWLVDVRGFRVNTQASLDAVKTTAGDFQLDMLSDAVNTPVRNQLVVKTWMEQALGIQTVAFTVDIKHAQDLAETFRHYGIKAEAVWGSDTARAEKLRAHKAKEITVLCNCGVLTEGYDDWRIGCILLARPTKSSGLYTQMVGRGTRLQEGTGNLLDAQQAAAQLEKTDCLIIDVCDTSTRHTLCTVPTLMGLNSDLDLKGQSALKSAQTIEKVQALNQGINFSALKDITHLTAFIERFDPFDLPYPYELASSTYTWTKQVNGGYVLRTPAMLRVSSLETFSPLDRCKSQLVATVSPSAVLGKWDATITDAIKTAIVPPPDPIDTLGEAVARVEKAMAQIIEARVRKNTQYRNPLSDMIRKTGRNAGVSKAMDMLAQVG